MLKTKVSLQGDLRRVTIPVIDFEVLTQKIREIYLLPASAALRVRFQDPDGDFVTISNDAGLADALTCCADTEILRLVVDFGPSLPCASSACAPPLAAAVEEKRRREGADGEDGEGPTADRYHHQQQQHHTLSHSCPGLITDAEQRQQLVETAALIEALEEAAKEAELTKLVAIHRRIAARRQTLTTESRKMAAKSRRLCQRGSAVERKIGALVRRSPHLAEQAAEAGILLPSQRSHSHAFCDSCNSAILLTETRFKCTMCFDFDLCQRCEAAAVHDPSHPMLKMQPEAQQRPALACELDQWWEAACQEFFTMLRTTSLSHIVLIAFVSFILSFFSAYALVSLITA